MARSYRSRVLTAGPEAVAAAVERAVTAKRPRLLGARAFDAHLRLRFSA